jgi:hypothetical protein
MAARATSGMVNVAPDRVSSRQASMMARRVLAFWFARPLALSAAAVIRPPL